MIVASGADVAGRVRCPSDAVDASSVIGKSCYRCAGDAHVENDDFAGVHGDCSEVVRILLVPGKSQQRCMRWILINDGAVFKMTQIKHSHRSISSNRRKHVTTATSARKRDVVNFFVVCDELRLDVTSDEVDSAEWLARFQSPDSAGGVNGRCSDEIWINFVPVEGREGRTEV